MAATLAATVAVGVGIALAKAERDRRFARVRRGRDRQFSLSPGEPLAAGLRRMALGQLDLAIELLERDWGGSSVEKTVHETRKSLKRLRALIRLLEGELGQDTFARENALLRDAGRRLAGARDAEVMMKTLDALLKRHPRKLGRRNSLINLRDELAAERDRATERLSNDTATRAEVLGQLRAVSGRVAEWTPPARGGIATVERGLKRLYRQGRRRRWRAARGKGDSAQAMHEWRKRVKDLRYAAEMLDRAAPAGGEEAWRARRGKRRRKQTRRGKQSGRISQIARRADQLGELLGEEHDLAVLAELVRSEGVRGENVRAGTHGSSGARSPTLLVGPRADWAAEGSTVGAQTRKTLLELIARRRRRLRRRALREGEALYRRRPKKFVRRVRDAYIRASRP